MGLESDDVTLVLKLGLSTRQDGRTVQIVRLPGPDMINRNKIIKISFRARTFVFLWVLNSWTDISAATPDPGPERSTETHLDRISLVSHPGVHHCRDMPGSFFNKKYANHRHSHGACYQLRVAVKNAATLERDPRGMATLDCKLLATATKVEAVLDVEREAKIAKEMPKRTHFLLQLLDNQAVVNREVKGACGGVLDGYL